MKAPTSKIMSAEVTPADNWPDSKAQESIKITFITETNQISCRKREILFWWTFGERTGKEGVREYNDLYCVLWHDI